MEKVVLLPSVLRAFKTKSTFLHSLSNFLKVKTELSHFTLDIV